MVRLFISSPLNINEPIFHFFNPKAMNRRLNKTRSYTFLFVFIAVSTIAFSQDKTVHFGPSFNARITHQITNESDYESSENSFSYSVAGNIYYNIGSKFQLISGVSFSQYKLNKIDSESYSDCGFSSSGELLKSYYREDYQIKYLGIPLEARWNFFGEENRLFLQFGLEGFLKLSSDPSSTLVMCNKEIEPSLQWDYFRTINNLLVLSKLGIGYEFRLNKKVNLFFEPKIEYSLTNFFKYDIFESKFFNVGLNTGIKF